MKAFEDVDIEIPDEDEIFYGSDEEEGDRNNMSM